MPGRQSHGGSPSKKPKNRLNNKKRSLNAFAIAAQENPDKLKIRQHRLGESESGNRPRKRTREDDAEDDEDTLNSKKPRKSALRAHSGGLGSDVDSDSEGNQWRMGEVDSDDDSDLDSDEAFGESDEERFDGFAFSGNSKSKVRRKSKGASNVVTLDELDENLKILDASWDEDSGDDAIDLAAMLDATEEDDVKNSKFSSKWVGDGSEESSDDGSIGSNEENDSEESSSSMEENDDNDPDKIAALQNLIMNLPQDSSHQPLLRQHNDSASEYRTPSDFGITSKTKLTLEDLGLPSIKDQFVKKSLKLLAVDSKAATKGSGISRKLEVPLAKRQQDRLDRSAAYDKTKETLNRWTDTVKHNRRAEHLVFPLPDPDAASLKANRLLQPTKPFNELEVTIQSILEESGLATTNGEDKLMEFEKLETNKFSIEEVKARRNHLRKARDLLFREEVRAKRIKKIKSKSYRRVHRKEREREGRMNKEALIEAGIQLSEDEQELQDRRRAEERMGARHRGSKWAKATKQTGRAAWDEDARAGITEIARRDEELRKRVEGKASRKDGIDESESSFSESDSEDSEDEKASKTKQLQRLEGVGSADSFTEAGPGSRLSNMKFILKAEASRKKENDEAVEKIRKELAAEISSEEEEADVGRRIFGPNSEAEKRKESPKLQKGSDFGETQVSDDEEIEITIKSHELHASNPETSESSQRKVRPKKVLVGPTILSGSKACSEGGAWSRPVVQKEAVKSSEARCRKQKNSDIEIGELDLSSATIIAKEAQIKRKSETKFKPLQSGRFREDGSDDDDIFSLPFAIKDQELIKKAFAGADVVGEFEAEKRQAIADEEEKTVDSTLPGWGSWVGEGLNKKEKQRNKGRFLTKIEGIKEQNRKDARLERVIINEKRVKKNGKYLASNLPHPFETRQQYERSLRLPVGSEWATKETFQNATKPRILVKQGIIAPMSKPLL